jgi:glucose/arabinose dehydrogenase
MRWHQTSIAAATWLAVISCGSGPASDGPTNGTGLTLRRLTADLSFPVALAAPAGDARLFVVEKGGRIRIFEHDTLRTDPFLDISALVSTGSEQGLLGLAFHPDYATNGRFFVDYTDTKGDTRIAEYHVSSDPAIADLGSASVMLTVPQPYSNHNGGQLAFGPDGYLYIGMGDGGSGGDPDGHGQATDDLLGSLLRIDVNGASPYTIPAGNPWADSAGARGEIWSIGLRNPWRFSFDRTTHDLYIADVGQGNYEEVDVSTAASGGGRGANYGWNTMEGNACYQAASCDRTGLVLPVVQYDHSEGCSITGGYVYRGSAIPDIRGHYFYADFCGGWIRSFRFADAAATDERSWDMLAPGGSITSFGEDAAGELYVMTSDGTLDRIVAEGS